MDFLYILVFIILGLIFYFYLVSEDYFFLIYRENKNIYCEMKVN